MLNDTKGIIFDLDGTLIDSMWIWPAVDDAYLGRYGLVKPEGFHQMLDGKSYREVAQLFLDLFPQIDSSTDEIMAEWTKMTYDIYVNEVRLKAGARGFLDSAAKAGLPLGIATSNSMELVSAVLKSLDIDRYFTSVRSANEVKSGKPSPDIYLLTASDLKIPPQQCLVFEDIPMGIMAGKNAGMRVCAVADDYSLPELEKKKELADYYIETYDDISRGTYEVCCHE